MTSRRTAMVDVELGEDGAAVTPLGRWKLWSLCRGLRIPYRAVVAARSSAHPDRELRPRWRVGGLGTPTTLAGYFTGPGGRSWWCYRYGEPAVILELELPRLRNVVILAADGGAGLIDAILAKSPSAPTVESR